ncbi:hypothetical protein V8G54_029182 [Vigna mungo]|uniref:Uncharacterized protein n=1 Tax=Vigna mungo TaxID=3915 RepID=A0AAQ3RK31_VIGMU
MGIKCVVKARLEWLATLGEVRADFGNLKLSIGKGPLEHVLQGDPTLSKSESNLKTLWYDFKQQADCYVLKWTEIKEPGADPVPSAILDVLSAHQDVFKDLEGLPPPRSFDHSIHLQPNASIPNLRPYKYSHQQKNEIEKLVQEMLHGGIIRPSISPYSSPIILVKKKDGGWRFCVDYRALNKVTIPNKFPIPVIEELLDELAGATMFSKLDLKSGYHQIRMRPQDIEKTAFHTHERHYEFLVMPFGLTNAPATFQALMNNILQSFLRNSTLDAHVQHLAKVLTILHHNAIQLNQKKCVFGQQQLEYLGHIISQHGVAADAKKPLPKTPKALRGLLGLTGYYRRFVQGYGKIAKPLTQLLSKDGFHWTEEARTTFEELKKVIAQLPVLAVPDFSKSFTLETYASGKGLGVVLLQAGRPLAFWSQALSSRAQNKSIYERELMALVQAVRKWKHYLMGSHFIILTDQRSLKFLIDQRLLTEEQFKWASKLIGFDFEIRFRPGKDNTVVDALSRKSYFMPISVLQPTQWDSWEEESQTDADLMIDPKSHVGYELRKGRLFYKGKLVLPRGSFTIPTIFKDMHESPTGGHSGYFRTFKRIAGVIYWKGMKNDIKEWVQQCAVCQRNKAETLAPEGLLQPLPIPTQVWSDISMDFIGGLPKVQGKDTTFVVVDRLTKYAHFLALAHPFTVAEVAQLFIKEIVRLHGFPSTIVSDRDKTFLSNFWKELFKQAGTKLRFSTAYHPQSDGQTEVVNRCLETYLRCMTGTHPRKWPQWLSWAEFWFNTNYSISTKMSPFKALYGCDPPLLLKGSTIPSKVQTVNQLQQERDELLRELKDNLCKAQDQNKVQANKHRRAVEFQVGDWVYLKLQPYQLKSLANRPNEKLCPRFYGPYLVQERVGLVAYKLDLPGHSRIHPVFHVSLLKRAIQPTTPVQPIPSALTEDLMLEVYPEELHDVRTSSTGDLEVLLKWQHLPSIENSWESATTINTEFLAFHLEDKAKLHGGGIDRFKGKEIEEANEEQVLTELARIEALKELTDIEALTEQVAKECSLKLESARKKLKDATEEIDEEVEESEDALLLQTITEELEAPRKELALFMAFMDVITNDLNNVNAETDRLRKNEGKLDSTIQAISILTSLSHTLEKLKTETEEARKENDDLSQEVTTTKKDIQKVEFEIDMTEERLQGVMQELEVHKASQSLALKKVKSMAAQVIPQSNLRDKICKIIPVNMDPPIHLKITITHLSFHLSPCYHTNKRFKE